MGWTDRPGRTTFTTFLHIFFTRKIKSLTRISVKNCVKINLKLKKNVIINVTGWSDRYCLWMRMKITVITDEQATGSHNKFMLIFIVGAPPLLCQFTRDGVCGANKMTPTNKLRNFLFIDHLEN